MNVRKNMLHRVRQTDRYKDSRRHIYALPIDYEVVKREKKETLR